jgi:hypothetical protein
VEIVHNLAYDLSLARPSQLSCRESRTQRPRSVIHIRHRPLVDLVNKIPAPICVAKEGIIAETKPAASVLQDHNLGRSMNLDLSLDEFEILP